MTEPGPWEEAPHQPEVGPAEDLPCEVSGCVVVELHEAEAAVASALAVHEQLDLRRTCARARGHILR